MATKRLDIITSIIVVAGLLGLFAVPVFLLVEIGADIWENVRVYTAYQSGVCKIESKKIRDDYDSEDGSSYQPMFVFQVRTRDGERLATVTGYDNVASSFSFSQKDKATSILNSFELEKTYPCWYDPEDPGKAVLARKVTRSDSVFILFPLLLASMGVSLIYYLIQEKKQASPTELSTEGQCDDLGYVTLRPDNTTAAGMPKGCASAGLFIGGPMLAVLVFLLFGNLLFEISPLLGFGVPALVPLGFIRWSLRSILTFRHSGNTRLELQGGSLVLGKERLLRIRKIGGKTPDMFQVIVTGKERVCYTSGTNTVSKEHLFYEKVLSDVTIADSGDLDQELSICLPPDVMPTFRAEHNSIEWRLRVLVRLPGLYEFAQDFPVQVVSA